jgi:hypothetical protein
MSKQNGSDVKSFLLNVYSHKDKLEAPTLYKNTYKNCTSLQFCGWAIVFDNETGEYFFSDTSGG